MIISIALTDKHNIGLDSYDRFLVGEEKVSIKEVPFVRYRFENYGEAEIDYIKRMKDIFKHSSHMVEITLDGNTAELLDKLEDDIESIIRFVYVPIDDTTVTNGFTAETEELLDSIADSDFDRIMIKDNSKTLYSVIAERLKKEISEITDHPIRDVGICQSPLSFHGNACLTAVKARELSAEYAENDEVALPSANHENMNTCGCIRYHLFTSDVAAPISARQAKNGDKKDSKPREVKPKGVVDIQF